MSHEISKEVIAETTHEEFAYRRKRAENSDSNLDISIENLGDEAIRDLRKAAETVSDKKLARSLDSIIAARSGQKEVKISSFSAAADVVRSYLMDDLIDGWIYAEDSDGCKYPYLITSISCRRDSHDKREFLEIKSIAFGHREEKDLGAFRRSFQFYPADLSRKTAADALTAKKVFKETDELKREYLRNLDRHRELIQNGFSTQYRVNGAIYKSRNYRSLRPGEPLIGVRAIHDTTANQYPTSGGTEHSDLLDVETTNQEGSVPIHTIARVFDLSVHEFYFVNTAFMEPYEYDKSLDEKLILPKTHRDLLDVLTSDIDVFTSDFIEGKSASNIILCKGLPGVGKTLTAEVYSELIEKPLYKIKVGTLGTEVTEIAKGLETIFSRARRWGCVLLLDEADVFVLTRSNDIRQNAVVAEFLKALEYFDGLLFMTTNRPDDIDDAILSRCAAIISYETPNAEDRRKVWELMASHYRQDLAPDLVSSLVALFPTASQRDIRDLMRLTARVCTKRGEKLSTEAFRKCAMFQAVDIADAA